ncbi:hypothetical protein [Nakamurella sp. PAMC28650]|uniref:hypothetical protein n=1 Tax=Nakamurella sp. PAMC28650 TaxID=2762325 RepID=UPI00164E12B4|nr:hypothetical protein [Nakamurella sp. PAMC28650]QNK81855.1 hypothetical protein H7F38_03380 [Nakamurella sp. PAMC28650]
MTAALGADEDPAPVGAELAAGPLAGAADVPADDAADEAADDDPAADDPADDDPAAVGPPPPDPAVALLLDPQAVAAIRATAVSPAITLRAVRAALMGSPR